MPNKLGVKYERKYRKDNTNLSYNNTSVCGDIIKTQVQFAKINRRTGQTKAVPSRRRIKQ